MSQILTTDQVLGFFSKPEMKMLGEAGFFTFKDANGLYPDTSERVDLSSCNSLTHVACKIIPMQGTDAAIYLYRWSSPMHLRYTIVGWTNGQCHPTVHVATFSYALIEVGKFMGKHISQRADVACS